MACSQGDDSRVSREDGALVVPQSYPGSAHQISAWIQELSGASNLKLLTLVNSHNGHGLDWTFLLPRIQKHQQTWIRARKK